MQTTTTGVNLGGWLVTERWMTPSLFENIDAKNQYELESSAEGSDRLAEHYKKFIDESDLDWLVEHGVTLLRVPIGYWLFGDVSPYQSILSRIDWLMAESERRGIRVLLCLHAAPGMQNDQEHGGYRKGIQKISWLRNEPAKHATIRILIRVAERYGRSPALWGIELLNEPIVDALGIRLAWFYRKAYLAITPYLANGVVTVFSDGFAPLRMTNTLGLMGSRQHPVAMDSHFYHCFSRTDKKRSLQGHLKKARRNGWILRVLQLCQPVIIGEWSAMLSEKHPASETNKFVATQLRAYRSAEATIYWSYKTESPGRWNFRHMVETGRYEL